MAKSTNLGARCAARLPDRPLSHTATLTMPGDPVHEPTFLEFSTYGALPTVRGCPVVPIKLLYRLADPLVIEARFGDAATWTLGRDLLLDGLNGRPGVGVGEGDVQIIRVDTPARTLTMRLSSPGGRAAICGIALDELTEFVDATCLLCPPGSEARQMGTADYLPAAWIAARHTESMWD